VFWFGFACRSRLLLVAFLRLASLFDSIPFIFHNIRLSKPCPIWDRHSRRPPSLPAHRVLLSRTAFGCIQRSALSLPGDLPLQLPSSTTSSKAFPASIS
jgi:hypothetical protein